MTSTSNKLSNRQSKQNRLKRTPMGGMFHAEELESITSPA